MFAQFASKENLWRQLSAEREGAELNKVANVEDVQPRHITGGTKQPQGKQIFRPVAFVQ